MRKTLLLLCIVLWTVPAGYAGGQISQLRPDRSLEPTSGISKSNPLRPARKPLPKATIEPDVTKTVVPPKTVHITKTYFFERLPSIDVTADPIVPPNAFDKINLVARGILTPDVSALVPDYLVSMANQPQQSLFESISNRPLMENRVGVQVALHQLLAGTIKNNGNLSASNYRIVQPTSWFGESMQRFDWKEFVETRPLEGLNDDSNEATYRISLNYSQVPNSFDEHKKSTRPIIRADVRASDVKVVESLLRQLEAVANEYWKVVAERGKLVAASDQLDFCQSVLQGVESRRDAIPENVIALARTGFDRSTKVRSDALVRLDAAQRRLANLVDDPKLYGEVEVQPQELPAGLTLQSVDQEVQIAKTNRVDAKTSPKGVAMDVVLAHKRLTFALDESNRSFHAIHSVKTNFEVATDKDNPIQRLTMALELQDRLREATTHFLDAIIGQQRALIDMKRAKGTLARTEIFPATGRLPQILTPGQPGTEDLTPEQLTLRPQSTFHGDPLVPPPAVGRMEGIPAEVAQQIPGQITHIDGQPVAASLPPTRPMGQQLTGQQLTGQQVMGQRPMSPQEPMQIGMAPSASAPAPAVPAAVQEKKSSSPWSAARRWLSKLTENQPLQRPTRR